MTVLGVVIEKFGGIGFDHAAHLGGTLAGAWFGGGLTLLLHPKKHRRGTILCVGASVACLAATSLSVAPKSWAAAWGMPVINPFKGAVLDLFLIDMDEAPSHTPSLAPQAVLLSAFLETNASRHYATGLESNTGALFLLAGRPALAQKELERHLTRFPHDGLAQGRLGVAFYRQNNFPRALTSLRRAVELSPRVALFRGYLALTKGLQGDLKGARQDARAFLELSPPPTAQVLELNAALRQFL
jgi:tetratricopeptide (TPR) repeat protein